LRRNQPPGARGLRGGFCFESIEFRLKCRETPFGGRGVGLLLAEGDRERAHLRFELGMIPLTFEKPLFEFGLAEREHM
jgi:hypothetical protein